MKRFSVLLFVVSLCFLTSGISNALTLDLPDVTGYEGSPITFDPNVGDIQGSLSYYWYLLPSFTPLSYNPTLTLSYFDDTVFGVSLTVHDAFFVGTELEIEIRVKAATGTINNVAPMVDSMSDQDLILGSMFNQSIPFYDPGLADIHSAEVWWGDSLSWDSASISGGSVLLSHTYFATGLYSVEVRVWDDDSGLGTSTFSVNVSDVSPVPEPATMLLLGTGLVGLVGFRKKFKK